MAFSNVLAKEGSPPDRLDTEAVATFEKVEAGWRLTTMALSVTGSVPGLSEDEFRQAAETAKNGCPVSNALQGNVAITVTASLG